MTLTAGRELDALVAEKVMGLERVGYLYKYREYTESPGHGNMSEKDIPPYSTSIAAAWEVVEKLAYEGKAAFALEFLKYEPKTWVAEFGIGVFDEGKADTAPLAICRAALKANDAHPQQ